MPPSLTSFQALPSSASPRPSKAHISFVVKQSCSSTMETSLGFIEACLYAFFAACLVMSDPISSIALFDSNSVAASVARACPAISMAVDFKYG